MTFCRKSKKKHENRNAECRSSEWHSDVCCGTLLLCSAHIHLMNRWNRWNFEETQAKHLKFSIVCFWLKHDGQTLVIEFKAFLDFRFQDQSLHLASAFVRIHFFCFFIKTHQLTLKSVSAIGSRNQPLIFYCSVICVIYRLTAFKSAKYCLLLKSKTFNIFYKRLCRVCVSSIVFKKTTLFSRRDC